LSTLYSSEISTENDPLDGNCASKLTDNYIWALGEVFPSKPEDLPIVREGEVVALAVSLKV
jgi:hypothetical protein